MTTRVNKDALKHAKKLIKDDQYMTDTDWSEAQPSTNEENDFLDDNGWDEYKQWYLGLDEDGSEETKERWDFPIGDFKNVHRAGVIAAKQRAAQYDYDEVEEAADELLELIDKREGND